MAFAYGNGLPGLWRIFMTLHAVNDVWKSADHLRTFYVHAMTGELAAQAAVKLTTAGFRFGDIKTSGSAIRVDANLDPIESSYYGWSEV